MTEQGQFAGNCPRKSHLRQLGIEIEEISEPTYIMWELGYANEDVTLKQLQASLQEGEVLLCEEEIPITWHTFNGTQVTGRPDIVICSPKDGGGFTPHLGLELKSIHSMWTARDILFGNKPKLPHVIQAAHYMWKLRERNPDCQWKIIYRSYSQLGQGNAGNSDSWVGKLFPAPGEPMSEYIEYNDKGGIKHIKQFERIYDIDIDNHGRVHYSIEGTNQWHSTVVTTADIERYFEFVSKMEASGERGQVPTTIDANGNKLNYTDCSYCPLKNTCAAADKISVRDGEKRKATYSEWLAEVRSFSASLKRTK